MVTCFNPICRAALRSQPNAEACTACGGVTTPLPETHGLSAYEAAATAPAQAPAADETTPEPAPAPPAAETEPAAERGPSEEENALLLEGLRTHEDDASTPVQPATVAPALEPVPGLGDLGIPTPPPATPATGPATVTQVIRFRPSADPTPAQAVIDDAAQRQAINDLEAQRRLAEELEQQARDREAADEARRQRMRAADEPTRTVETPAPRRPATVTEVIDAPEPSQRRQHGQPSSANLQVPTNRSWLWYVAAAAVLIGVLAWWLFKDHGDGTISSSAIAADDSAATSSAPTSSIDPVARGMARKALSETDRLTTGLGKVGGRVTNLEHAQDGRVIMIGADSPSCEYRSFGACVEGLMATGDKRLVEAGIISLAEARASAERTCRVTGCGRE